MPKSSIKQITHSEIQISPKDGIKAQGFISWAVLGSFVFVAVFYLRLKYGDKIKGHIVRKYKARKKKK